MYYMYKNYKLFEVRNTHHGFINKLKIVNTHAQICITCTKTINKLFEVRNNHHGFIYID